MVGVDMDGVYAAGFRPIDKDFVIVTGRSVDDFKATLYQTQYSVPVYVRPEHGYHGATPDDVGRKCGRWKALVINFANITDFYEDDPIQAEVIKNECPNCKVHRVDNGHYMGLWYE